MDEQSVDEQDFKRNPNLENSFRSEDFYDDYANNVYLESSAWDLKLTFGQLDQSTIPVRVEQHGAVSLPWNQAKIFAYLLCLHLAAYEMGNGQIPINDQILPPEPEKPTEEAIKQDPNGLAFYNRMMWLREQFFGKRPLGLNQ